MLMSLPFHRAFAPSRATLNSSVNIRGYKIKHMSDVYPIERTDVYKSVLMDNKKRERMQKVGRKVEKSE